MKEGFNNRSEMLQVISHENTYWSPTKICENKIQPAIAAMKGQQTTSLVLNMRILGSISQFHKFGNDYNVM